MKVKNYFIMILLTIVVLFVVLEHTYAENKASKNLNEFNEDVYNAIDTICNINYDYNISNLKMLSENFGAEFYEEDIERYLSNIIKDEKVINSDTYFILEDGMFATTRADANSMYDILTQEEIEEINQLYDDIETNLVFTCHKKFVKGKDDYYLFMGVPLYDNSYKFKGVIVNDFKASTLEYITKEAFKNLKYPINVSFTNDGKTVYEDNQYKIIKMGKTLEYENDISCYGIKFHLDENLNVISFNYRLTRILVVILLFLIVTDFTFGMIVTKKDEQYIRALYVIFGVGMLLVLLNMFAYFMLIYKSEKVKLETAVNLTGLVIETEAQKNERDIVSLCNLIDDDKYQDRMDTEDFLGDIDIYYSRILEIAIKNIDTLSYIYAYDDNGKMLTYPKTNNTKYHILPERYLTELKNNKKTIFFKEMTDVNTQASSSFLIRPYIVDGKYIGSIALVYDNQKIINILKENNFVKSINKYIISRDGKMTNLNTNESVNIFSDYTFVNNGEWDDGEKVKRDKITYNLKKSKKNRHLDAISTRYTTELIGFEDNMSSLYIDTAQGVVMNVLLYLGIYIFFSRLVIRKNRKKDELLKAANEEYEKQLKKMEYNK